MEQENKILSEVDMYAEIGGLRNPRLLAKKYGVRVLSFPHDIGEEINGIYKVSARSSYCIFLNPTLEIDDLEATVHLLLVHHKVDQGVEKVICKSDLKRVNRIASEVKRVSNLITETFLQGRTILGR